MLQRQPVTLTQVKASSTSKKLLSNVRHIV